MSGFEDNPFGDNPFQDPSIKQATANNPAKGLEDYNPFEDAPQNQRPTTVPISPSDGFDPMVRGAANPPQYGTAGDPSKSPAVMSPTQEMPPSYTKSNMPQQNPPQISTEELLRRQEELERKARELERREEELRNTPFNARKNNWPPLPERIPIQPCFYQDINVDIPVEFQRIVRYLYYIWIIHSAVLIVNVLVYILRVTVLDITEFGNFFAAIIYVVVFTPASYICWFRPAYKAFRSDSSFNFMVFFFIFFFQFIVSVAMSMYLPGACGIVDAIKVIKLGGVSSIVIGILALIIGLAFFITAALDLYLLVKVHRIYRSSGASFAKAQQEFASGVMRNEHVQGAASNIASEAIRAQINNMAAGNNANAPRY